MNGSKLMLTVFVLLVYPVFSSMDYDEQRTEVEVTHLENSILVFSKTTGFRHGSIEKGIEAVKRLGERHGVHVYATEDPAYFNESDLSHFDAVLFLNTTGDLFTGEQKEAFKEYIRNGGGFAGVHSAADTEYDWPWYGELVGGWFHSHPPVQTAVVEVVSTDHPSTGVLPQRWERADEWYNYQEIPDHVEVLLTLDTDSFEGSEHPGHHPIAWYHDFDGGRAFYTGLGHTDKSYSEELFLQHLWGGLKYAMGRTISSN